MNINELLQKKHMTRYRLSKSSNVPYATLSDIFSGKTPIGKCSAETVYRIAKSLDTTVEELLTPYLEIRPDFALFKSNVCHSLKEHGDIDFLIESLNGNRINLYYEKRWYPECFYLLAMVDYLSRLNNVPLCKDYDKIRGLKLEKPLFPSGIISMSSASGNNDAKEDAIKNAIPEFMRFNIVESDIRNVV